MTRRRRPDPLFGVYRMGAPSAGGGFVGVGGTPFYDSVSADGSFTRFYTPIASTGTYPTNSTTLMEDSESANELVNFFGSFDVVAGENREFSRIVRRTSAATSLLYCDTETSVANQVQSVIWVGYIDFDEATLDASLIGGHYVAACSEVFVTATTFGFRNSGTTVNSWGVTAHTLSSGWYAVSFTGNGTAHEMWITDLNSEGLITYGDAGHSSATGTGTGSNWITNNSNIRLVALGDRSSLSFLTGPSCVVTFTGVVDMEAHVEAIGTY